MQSHLENTETILQDGVGNIAGEVANIGPVIAGALQNAMQGVNVVVQVNTDQGLVTQ